MIDFSQILPKAPLFQTNRLEKKHAALLTWKENKHVISDFQINTPQSHQWFNTHLHLNDICDIGQIEVPGAIILLPWGQQICERFATLVRESAANLDYQEYAYPSLIPKNYFNPIKDLINIEKSLLNLSDDYDLALSPTGECLIYQHWHTTIKTKHDLPKKIFQRAKYFRPITSSKRSGGSVFLSMEASDVFEFHACFAKSEIASHEATQLLSLFKDVTEKTGTFALWSMRPSWTNKGNLYQWSFAGDALLPSHHSIQIACSYYQDTIFSERFNIAFHDNSENTHKKKQFTFQATGAITRRLVFAHLFQSMRSDGSLCLHPNIAPIQLLLLLTASNSNGDDEQMVNHLIADLKKTGIRVLLKKPGKTRHLHQEEKRWHRWGIPLKLLFFGREKHDNIRLVLMRNDTKQELSDLNPLNLSPLIALALQDIINAYPENQQYSNHITDCKNLDDVKQTLHQHKVASCPLLIHPASVAHIESFKKGEVLGFYASETPAPCVISHQPTNVRAFVSRRI